MTHKKPEAFPHQKECFERFKDAPYVAILAEMGTGKSRMVLDIVEHKNKTTGLNRAVIIAPVAVGPQWHNEQLPTHLDVPYQSCVYKADGASLAKDKLAQKKFFIDCVNDDQLKFFIINAEAFVRGKGAELVKKFLATSDKPCAIIVDEASKIKNPDAKRSKNIMRIRDLYPDSFRSVLTGTPAAKSPVDMYNIFEFLKPRYMECSYMAFKAYHEVEYDRTLKIKDKLIRVRTSIDPITFMKIRKWINNNPKTPENELFIRDKFGLSNSDYQLIATSEEFVRYKHVDQLQRHIAKDTFAVSKKDCLELPDKVYQVIELTMNAEQKRQINQLAKYSATVYKGKTLTVSTKAVLGTRVLQICGGNLAVHTSKDKVFDTVPIKGPNAKLNYILDDLEEAGDQPCIVWAVFVPEVIALSKAIGEKYPTVSMHGETSESARIDAVRKFKSGEAQVLVANPEVGGYGLNFQHAGVQYWYSRSYKTESRLQAEDRSHRIGTVKAPIYKDLVYNSKFERNVLEVLQEGKDMNDQFVTMQLNDMFAID